jgi:hypothetical protein
MKPTRTPVCLRRREEPLMDLSGSERYLNITRGTRLHSVIFVISLKFNILYMFYRDNIQIKTSLVLGDQSRYVTAHHR